MQSNTSFFIITLFIAITTATAILKNDDEINDRIIDKDLSDQKHYINSQHNPEYDHEAFLGEESQTFKQLTPDESIKRLGLIVNKIDTDRDGFVTAEELKNWIKYIQTLSTNNDINKKWSAQNREGKEKISWEEYHKNNYGAYIKAEKVDRRRWSAADLNRDDALSKEEFASFIHPEENEHMKDIVVLETIDDLDKDKDGRISLSEYIADMMRGRDGNQTELKKIAEEQFSMRLDTNGDGTLNSAEVKNWILPTDYDRADVEARHLIREADFDTDQKLTKDEIIKKHDLFVGSRATDYGEALVSRNEF